MFTHNQHHLRNRRFFWTLRKCFGIFIFLFAICFIPIYSTYLMTFITSGTIAKSVHEKRSFRIITEYKRNFFEQFMKSNQSLCNEKTYQRGRHQKIIALSIYGTASKFTDNQMFRWNESIMPFLEPLVEEVHQLLPSWIVRIYTDLVGSTQPQRELIYNFTNVDVCDVNSLPIFNSSLLNYLPGRMWRFLAVFDPYVDYMLSRDLDSPMTLREKETIDLWLSDEHTNKFFHVVRDHPQHGAPILGGLWGAATVRARDYLREMFVPIFDPNVPREHNGTSDQVFLDTLIWNKVKNHSLIFDSFHCKSYGGQPFPSPRMNLNCFLGCIRSCCTNTTFNKNALHVTPCPLACRPKDHQDWEYC